MAAVLGVTPDRLLAGYQIPTPDWWSLMTWTPGESAVRGATSRAFPSAIGVSTADCGPLLFADDATGVIGAAHAGWRGALTGVIEATIGAMEQLGADRDGITVALGPTIRQANYEVGPEFVERS